MRSNFKSLLLTFSLVSSIVYADNYSIVSINTPSIKIGEQTFSKGSTATFSDRAVIYWSSDQQVLRALNTNQRGYAPRTFTKAMFRQRNVTTIYGYLNSLNTNILHTQSGVGRNDKNVYFDVLSKSTTSTASEKRLALVIGNSNYLNQNVYPNLRNAAHDAEQVASALRNRGFDVILSYDCTKFQLDSCLTYFINKASTYDVALFYYAGHGLMFNKADYLVPIDAKVERPEDVERECSRTSYIIRRLNYTSRLQNLIVLDACRSVKHRWVRSAYDQDEWTAPTTPYGTHVLYSTQNDEEAYDGNTDLSPFADNYIKAINVPGLNTNDVIQRVIDGVIDATNQKQFPTGIGSTKSNFLYYPTSTSYWKPIFDKFLKNASYDSNGYAYIGFTGGGSNTEEPRVFIRNNGPYYELVVNNKYGLIISTAGDIKLTSPNSNTSFTYTKCRYMYCYYRRGIADGCTFARCYDKDGKLLYFGTITEGCPDKNYPVDLSEPSAFASDWDNYNLEYDGQVFWMMFNNARDGVLIQRILSMYLDPEERAVQLHNIASVYSDVNIDAMHDYYKRITINDFSNVKLISQCFDGNPMGLHICYFPETQNLTFGVIIKKGYSMKTIYGYTLDSTGTLSLIKDEEYKTYYESLL